MLEVLFTSDAAGQLWNACSWDPQTGASIVAYKGGSASPGTMTVLAGEYLISAVANKPLLHVWALQRKDQQQTRVVCPGCVSAFAASPDGSYCVASVGEKIHLWQVCTGRLLAVVTRHYQTIRKLSFTDDGSHFVSGGDDNLILVWSMSTLLSSESLNLGQGNTEPLHIWSAHSLPITDLQVGRGGVRCRVVSASLDQTCKLWELSSGLLLCNIVFDQSLTSVAMDTAEQRVFVGTLRGNVYQTNLFEHPVRMERHETNQTQRNLAFNGHTKQVTCLAVSMDGSVLVSGSHDMTVRLWDVPSHQCVRTIPHKSVVTNVLLVPTPRGLIDASHQPRLPLQPFQRQLYTRPTLQNTGGNSDTDRDTLHVQLTNVCEPEDTVPDVILTAARAKEQQLNEADTEEMHQTLHKLTKRNKELFDFTVEKILKPDKAN